MKRALFAALAALVLLNGGAFASAAGSADPAGTEPPVTQRPTATPKPTPSPTPKPTATPMPTPTPRLTYGGKTVDENTTRVTVPSHGSIARLAALADYMPNLRDICFGDREPTAEELALLTDAFPKARLVYRVRIGRQSFSCSDKQLDLNLRHQEVDQAAEKLALLPNVRRVVLPAQREIPMTTDLTLADVGKLQQARPEAVFDYRFTRWDRTISTADEVLDLTCVTMDDNGAAVREILPYMTALKTLNMDRCGVSNEDMAAIRDDYPDIDVIWRIWFGPYYTCRTDVEMILASLAGVSIKNENGAQNLKYCTKVRYLDLGHNPELEDISFVQYMPDLEVAILAINAWTDATPLASCPKLEYLEMFNTKCTDLSPLVGLKNLRHLNVCYLWELEDISPLMEMTWLERLWVGQDNLVPWEDRVALQEALPNCQVNITQHGNPTGDGWRYHERYALLRQQFDYDNEPYAVYYY